ncbi:MAG: hypothetical protein E7399_02145 [Ruminococcaceae bacterium]|nr:hypothetical protein [Oscillospiraceae bacterium]
MKKGKLLSAVTIIMGIIMVLYIATLALPHMDYSAATRVPTGVGDETELVMEEKGMSVLSFLAFPDSSKETAVRSGMQAQFGDSDYSINGATTGPVLLLVLAILGAVCAFMKSNKFIASILPLAWSIYGLVVYFTNSYIKLGGVDYWVQLAIIIVVGILAIALGIIRLPGVIAERKQIRMEIRITKERERGMQVARESADK